MRVFLAALLAFGLLTAPAGAEEPQVNDVCGDSTLWIWASGETVNSPDPASPNFDIRSGGFATAPSGVDFQMQVCGEVVEPAYGQHYAWSWLNEAGCDVSLRYGRSSNVNIPGGYESEPVLTFSQMCDAPEQTLPVGTEVEETFRVTLDAAGRVTADGDTLTVSLRSEDLPAEAATAIAGGSQFIEPLLSAQLAFGPGNFFVYDQTSGHGVIVGTGRDNATGSDFTVGQ